MSPGPARQMSIGNVLARTASVSSGSPPAVTRQGSQSSIIDHLASHAKDLVRETRQGSQEGILAHMDKVRSNKLMPYIINLFSRQNQLPTKTCFPHKLSFREPVPTFPTKINFSRQNKLFPPKLTFPRQNQLWHRWIFFTVIISSCNVIVACKSCLSHSPHCLCLSSHISMFSPWGCLKFCSSSLSISVC